MQQTRFRQTSRLRKKAYIRSYCKCHLPKNSNPYAFNALLPCHRPTSHQKKIKKRYLSVFSHASLLRVLSFYLKSYRYARQRKLSIVFGALLCAMHLRSGSQKGKGEFFFWFWSVFFYWMYAVVTTNHCSVRKRLCASFTAQPKHVTKCLLVHVRPPSCFPIDWVEPQNQCVGSLGGIRGGFCTLYFPFYFCSFRVYQLRASIAPPFPSPFVQCWNQIKHLWRSVSSLLKGKVPVMDGRERLIYAPHLLRLSFIQPSVRRCPPHPHLTCV